MNRLQRAAVLSRLVERLREHGSWAGETHVQKAAYLLEHAAEVPLDYNFVLYKHGPFSFDLRDELNELNADGLLVIQPQVYPYGPKLRVTDLGYTNLKRHPKTVERYDDDITRVVDFLGHRGVSTLERLATAFFLHEESPSASDEELAKRLVTIKPHVSRLSALMAVEDLRKAMESLKTSPGGRSGASGRSAAPT